MRKLFLLTAVLVVFAACGGDASATGAAVPRASSTPTEQPQPTATSSAPETVPIVEEQRVKNIEFRLSELERLLSAGDGMFSLTDDLSNVDGRLRAQQRCINALVLAASRHRHNIDPDEGITGDGQFTTLGSSGQLDEVAHARMLTIECGPAVDEALLAQLADNYGLDAN